MPLPLRSLLFEKNRSTSKRNSQTPWIYVLLATGYIALILLISFRSGAQVLPPDAPTPWWMSYVGGSSSDQVRKVFNDPRGNYIIGTGGNFGGWPTEILTSYQGGATDAFIIRLSDSYEPLWQRSVGGSATDEAFDAVMDEVGNVYITGITASSDWATDGAYQENFGGTTDAFVCAFAPDGVLLWSTYIGGNAAETYSAITQTSDGQLIVAVSSSSGDLPSTGSLSTGYGGGISDVYLVSLSLEGEHNWSGYYGGTGDDKAFTLAPWGDGGFIFCGETSTPNVTSGGFQTDYAGGGDGWVAAFSGSAVHQWSTYVGGPGKETITAVDVDHHGLIALAGYTNSNSGINTLGPGPLGGFDAFVVQLSSAGSRLWSRYLGGNNLDQLNAVKVDAFGQIYVAGVTSSTNVLSGNWTDGYGGGLDGFVAKVKSNGELDWAGYLGGSANDEIFSLATQNGTRLFFGGVTGSNNSVRYGYDSSFNGGNDGYFGLFQDCLNPEITLDMAGDSVFCDGDIVTFYAGGAAHYEWMNGDTLFSIDVDTTQLVYVTGSSASGCRARSRMVNVESLPVPEVFIYADGPIEFCDSGTVVLHATGATAYEWGEEETGDSFLAINQGPISAIGIAENGCRVSSNVILILFHEIPDVLMAVANDTVCISDDAVSLIGLPLGGNFVGNGVSGNLFDPFDAGGGRHEVYYEYTSEQGCYVQTPIQEIEVFFSPTVLFLAEDTLCFDDPELELLGLPTGGAFSGDGVIDNLFYPSISGIGPQNITYSYLDERGCTNIANQIIIVDACASLSEEDMQNEPMLVNTWVEQSMILHIPFNWTNQVLQVFDSRGRLINTHPISGGENRIDMDYLFTGIYFLKLENEEKFWSEKFQKM